MSTEDQEFISQLEQYKAKLETTKNLVDSKLDEVLKLLEGFQAPITAKRNRSATFSTLKNVNENTTVVLNPTKGTDFAAETAILTQQQALQHASTAVLTQANEFPSAVLKLLQ